MRWERVQLPQAREPEQGREEAGGPGKRWAHTCNATKGGRFLYMFGGFGKDNCQTNQVHVFDTVEQTWSQPTIEGAPPAPRDSHSCTNVGDNLFVFGGTDRMNPLGNLHILDTSSHTWISPITRGEVPEARQGHSAALVGERLFIFGGYGKSSDDDYEVYYNDLFILSTETFVWIKATRTGMLPSPRHTHSCSTRKNKMIVIGGEDGHDDYLSNVHILDAETLMWKELNTTGHMLPSRAGYLTVTFGKILFVYGGYTESQKPYDDLYMLYVGARSNPYKQLVPVQGEQIFQGRVMKNFGDRYTIETNHRWKASPWNYIFQIRSYGDPSTVMKNGRVRYRDRLTWEELQLQLSHGPDLGKGGFKSLASHLNFGMDD